MGCRTRCALFFCLCLVGLCFGYSLADGQVQQLASRVYNNGDCLAWWCTGTYSGCTLNGQNSVQTCQGNNNNPCNPYGQCCSWCSGTNANGGTCSVPFYYCP
jgi:hypothetical protein